MGLRPIIDVTLRVICLANNTLRAYIRWAPSPSDGVRLVNVRAIGPYMN